MSNQVEFGAEYKVFKSTLDFLARDMAKQLAILHETEVKVSEAEDLALFEDVLKGANTAIIYMLDSFAGFPRKPRYQAEFSLGVKTKGDNANMLLSSLISYATGKLGEQARFEIKDYTQDQASPRMGMAHVMNSYIGKQKFDKTQGIRFLVCKVALVINGSQG